MWGGEVDFSAEPLLELFVEVELRAVVGGDRPDRMWFALEQRGGALERLLRTEARQFADSHEAAFAFDDGDGPGFAAAVHRVDLPIAEAGPPFDHGRTLRDHPFTSEATAAVMASVALALEFAGSA